MSTAPISITDRISARMNALGLSAVDLAARCQVSEQTAKNWLQNAENIRAWRIRPISRALECSVEYLLGLSDEVGQAA